MSLLKWVLKKLKSLFYLLEKSLIQDWIFESLSYRL